MSSRLSDAVRRLPALSRPRCRRVRKAIEPAGRGSRRAATAGGAGSACADAVGAAHRAAEPPRGGGAVPAHVGAVARGARVRDRLGRAGGGRARAVDAHQRSGRGVGGGTGTRDRAGARRAYVIVWWNRPLPSTLLEKVTPPPLHDCRFKVVSVCVCFLRLPLCLCVSVVNTSVPGITRRRFSTDARSELRRAFVLTTLRHRGTARRSATRRVILIGSRSLGLPDLLPLSPRRGEGCTAPVRADRTSDAKVPWIALEDQVPCRVRGCATCGACGTTPHPAVHLVFSVRSVVRNLIEPATRRCPASLSPAGGEGQQIRQAKRSTIFSQPLSRSGHAFDRITAAKDPLPLARQRSITGARRGSFAAMCIARRSGRCGSG